MPAAYELRIDWAADGFSAGTKTAVYGTANIDSTDTTYIRMSTTDGAKFSPGSKTMVYLSDGTTLRWDAIYTVMSVVDSGGYSYVYVMPNFQSTIANTNRLYTATLSGDDVLARHLDPITVSFGRETVRELSPVAAGVAAFTLDNASQDYSPDNTGSPIYPNVKPARPVRLRAVLGGTTYGIFQGYVDDLTPVHGVGGKREVPITCVDDLVRLKGTKLSTAVYQGKRTGELISQILTEVGWTAGTDLDPGDTIVRYWWEEGTDAYTAIQKLVQSEGIPAFVSISADGTFIFRDRTHRFRRTQSTTTQATFAVSSEPRIVLPLEVDHGWKDVINSVTIETNRWDPRRADEKIYPDLDTVWTSTETYTIPASGTLVVQVYTEAPFIGAVVPVEGVDYSVLKGSVTVTLARTSGQSVGISLQAGGAQAQVQELTLRAVPLVQVGSTRITYEDATSVAAFGRCAGENVDMPWACEETAYAVARQIVSHRKDRVPVYRFRVVNTIDATMVHQLSRTISDKVHLTCPDQFVSADAYIEHITHEIKNKRQTLVTTYECERIAYTPFNAMAFGVAGRGFDDGMFAI